MMSLNTKLEQSEPSPHIASMNQLSGKGGLLLNLSFIRNFNATLIQFAYSDVYF